MSSISLCNRRPSWFTTKIRMRTKPPDLQPMVYTRVSDDLRKAKYELALEEARCEQQSKEVEDLREQVKRLTQEKQETVKEYIIARQEAERLSRSNGRLHRQLKEAREDIQEARKHSLEPKSAQGKRSAQRFLDNSSTSSNVINEGLKYKLRVAVFLLGVEHCVHSEKFSKTHDVKALQQELQNMSTTVSNLRQQNAGLRTQHEVNMYCLREKEDKLKIMEANFNRMKCTNESLVRRNNEQEVIKTDMMSVICQLREEQVGCKRKIRKLVKDIEYRYDKEERVREQVEEVEESNSALKKMIDASSEQMRVLSHGSESLKMKMKLDQGVGTMVTELLAGIRALRETYEQVSKIIKDGVNASTKEGGIIDTREKLQQSTEKRKLIFNQIQDIRGNVRVFCRVRPPKGHSQVPPIITIPHSTTRNNWTVICRDECFSFDRVFGQYAANKDIYEETAGVVETVLDGSNVCILAYGQTGSGKSYTMEGVGKDPGVNFLALKHLFQLLGERKELATVSVYVSVLEVYNDELQDLLVDNNPEKESNELERRTTVNSNGNRAEKRKESRKLRIRKVQSDSDEVHVPGLVQSQVTSLSDVRRIMILAKRRRSVSSTRMNTESSRSHLIVQVKVQRQGRVSKLHLVDLAGSERVQRSQVTGTRLKEAIHINKSLSTLGNVFSALEHQRSHVPYRDTKLTHILSNSIGRKAKTLMFITVSEDSEDMAETWGTLEFGKRVGKIVLHENDNNEKIDQLRALEKELRKVDMEIDKARKILSKQ